MALPLLQERLQQPRPLLLDGATGTELNRRGINTDLPLWSARALLAAPEVLRSIHREYVAAGAELLTANTFRTHRRNLAHAGFGDRAAELTGLAIEIAKSAAEGRAWVAGSQPPLEDCYSPELVPDDQSLRDEHTVMAEHLAAAGVDAILVETHNTIREAVAATNAAGQTGLPVLISFVGGVDGRLLSGESLEEAVRAVMPFAPAAVLVNCVPAESVPAMLEQLQPVVGDRLFGAYANIGRSDPVEGWINTDAQNPLVYAGCAESWLAAGARVIGGCCGTTPGHIDRLRALIAETTA